METVTKPDELLPCPFERGQVWTNPDDELMMVISVQIERNGYCNRGAV